MRGKSQITESPKMLNRMQQKHPKLTKTHGHYTWHSYELCLHTVTLSHVTCHTVTCHTVTCHTVTLTHERTFQEPGPAWEGGLWCRESWSGAFRGGTPWFIGSQLPFVHGKKITPRYDTLSTSWWCYTGWVKRVIWLFSYYLALFRITSHLSRFTSPFCRMTSHFLLFYLVNNIVT